MNIAKERFEITIRRTKWIEGENGSGHSEELSPESCEIEVTADLLELARKLGPRAAKSQGRKAIEAGGLVVVKCLSSTVAATRSQESIP